MRANIIAVQSQRTILLLRDNECFDSVTGDKKYKLNNRIHNNNPL